METKIILKYEETCRVRKCPKCEVENNIEDGWCVLCGTMLNDVTISEKNEKIIKELNKINKINKIYTILIIGIMFLCVFIFGLFLEWI